MSHVGYALACPAGRQPSLFFKKPLAHARGSVCIIWRTVIEFKKLIARLKKAYGEPALPPARGPFELVMWENACYLLPDERRAAVFEGLRQQVGMDAESIWKADQAVLLPLAKLGGMRPETRVFRWREIARIAISQFAGDLDSILELPYDKAKRALHQFPNIGQPGAEKILMLCGMSSGLPLESNGLRVLERVGFGRAQKNYGATYRSVQGAIAEQIPKNAAALTRAHLLLRYHGKAVCRTNRPLCEECVVASDCKFAAKQV
jgi:endonuclease-3